MSKNKVQLTLFVMFFKSRPTSQRKHLQQILLTQCEFIIIDSGSVLQSMSHTSNQRAVILVNFPRQTARDQ